MKKRIFRTPRREGKRRRWRVCSANFRCGWKEVRKMAQERFSKEGNRGLDPRCSFNNNSVKYSIDKTSETPLCRLCGECTETVWHISSGCRKLAQKEHRKRHDKVAL